MVTAIKAGVLSESLKQTLAAAEREQAGSKNGWPMMALESTS
jgi:hypothetical protein